MDISPLFRNLLILTLILKTTYATVTGVNFCPRAWTRTYQYCHKIGTEFLDFYSARRECLGMGGDLAAITSEGSLIEMREQIQGLLGRNFSRQQFWTGLFKQPTIDSRDTWVWSNGEPTDLFLKIYQPTGNGSAVWMNTSHFGVAELAEEKPYICQRKMITMHKEYCSEAICVVVQGYGANHSGQSSRDECRKIGSDIPIEGAHQRIWSFLKNITSIYAMDQPVWVQGEDGQYSCLRSLFNKTACLPNELGRTVCIQDNYDNFKVPQCPCKWEEWNEQCFFVAGRRVKSQTYEGAVEFCSASKSSLATIDSLEDFNYFKRDYKGLNKRRAYWISKSRFAATVPMTQESQTTEVKKCTLLVINYNSGITFNASLEERNCAENHQFICKLDLQTSFPKSICEEGTFTHVCYNRISRKVPSGDVICDVGKPLSVGMLNVVLHNTKGTPVNHSLLWQLTATTGCTSYWINNGKRHLRFEPQRKRPLFYMKYQYDTENLPFICVTEELTLATKLGVAVGFGLLSLIVLTGILGLLIHRRRIQEEIYDEVSDLRPVLPPRQFVLQEEDQFKREIHYQKNDAYEPYRNTELHM